LPGIPAKRDRLCGFRELLGEIFAICIVVFPDDPSLSTSG
jgi:hypothetical protein